MNIIVASSRGRHLDELMPDVTVRFKGGATLDKMMEKAKTITAPTHNLGKRYHIYFVGGIPNITKLIRNYSEHHSECVYDEEPTVTATNFLIKIQEIQRVFLERGALPIFTTIPKVHLAKYNTYLLLNKKTSTLRFSEQYSNMQTKLNEAIDTINKHIFETNQKIKVTTPLLHMTIRDHRGEKGHRYIIHRWDLLYDGVHASEALREKWAGVLQKAMKENGKLEDAEEQVPQKRYSKYESERKGSE